MEEFEEVVKYVTEAIEGVSLAGVIGRDGLPVSLSAKSDMDKAEASAELASIFNVVVKSTKALNIGLPTELIFNTQSLSVLINPISEDYFLVIVMQMPANIGRARLEVRKFLPRLEEMIK